MPKILDRTGQRFGRLIVEGRGEDTSQGKPRWRCLCECGGNKLADGASLKSGRTLSCGCLQRERTAAAARISSRTHGRTESPEYCTWGSMRTRCLNPNATGYKRYGGRGIKICDRWDSFENFLADMGERPSPNHTLDRVDKNGNYTPENCRWADKLTQANNRRDNVLANIDGEVIPIGLAVRKFGHVISRRQAARRIAHGWDHKSAVSTPPTR
jgi:hypothetical protein